MGAKLEFFYDYVSTYSYLANSRLATLREAEIVYRPMFLGAVLRDTGNRAPGEVEAKYRYLLDDLQRWARHYGVQFRMNPKFPQNTLGALRLAILARHKGCFAELHQRLFDAMWVHGADLSDEAVLAAIVMDAGLSPDEMLAGIGAGAIKDELKANTAEAIGRGAFGAPTFFVGEQMFFGNDRFDFVREALRDG